MRILLIADIHSNWPALEAITEPFDVCLCLGDLVDYATDPIPCLDWVRRKAQAVVRGNHDHAVAQRIAVRRRTGLGRLASEARPHHWKVLTPSQLSFLGRLPVTRRVEFDQHSFYLVHATPRDPMDEYLKDDAEAWENRLQEIDADFVCVGHTHIPFCVDVGRTRIINPGSVGQPRDGDPRAAYCLIENGEVHFRRVEYDIDRTIQQMRECGISDDTLEVASHFLRTGGRMPPGESQLMNGV